MADFKYITKLDQHPKGKQRVYFTCHPQDFKPTFEEIKNDILDRQDVAIFYLEPDTRPEEVDDYELQLGEMQLFVVPVTTKLLTTPNRVIDVEVPFAQEHHIPILPLMRESRLDELFNEKFGDLQYLEKFNTDPTAIPFDEKLTNYLESVIVGDELARQVRAAFDAYIFLSYRKKDRKYAQELMKLIHENDFARDIAIWYDEFLTPGEDFNKAIKAALQKSDLFALTVTPNLLEMPGGKPNFVMDKEFPAARDSGKPILPAEMLATNRNELNDKYTDIPEPVGEGDKKALGERLLSLLKKIAVAENDKDPQHNYFIGLAYLSGIDVEVDYNKAEELITGAAEQNFIPAVKKLVNMYSTGKGVIRDYHKAAEWQERIVELCKAEYDSQPSVDNAVMLLSELSICGNAYYDFRHMERSKEMFLHMNQYADQFCGMYDDYVFPRMLSLSFDRLGDIDLKEAGSHYESYYRSSFELREKVARETGEIYDRSALATSYDKLGNVVWDSKIIDYVKKAYDLHFEAYKIREAIVDETNSVHALRDLAISLVNMSYPTFLMKCEKKSGEKTEDLLKRAIEVREKLVSEIGDEIDKVNLNDSYYHLARTIYRTRAAYCEAEEYLLKGSEICWSIVKDNDSIDIWRDLLYNYAELIDVAYVMHDKTKQASYGLQAVEIAETLAKKTVTVESLSDLIRTYDSVIHCYLDSIKDYDIAKKLVLKKTEARNKLKSINPNAVSEHDEWHDIVVLCDIEMKMCEFEKADDYFREAIQLRSKAGDEQDSHYLIRVASKLGDIAKQKKKWEKAESYYIFVADQQEDKSNRNGDSVSTLRERINTYQTLAELSCQNGKTEKEMEWLLKESKVLKAIPKEDKTATDYRNESICLEKFGNAAKEIGRIDEAESFYRECLRIREQITKVKNDALRQDDLAVAYYNLGSLLSDSELLESAHNIWMELYLSDPNNQRYKAMLTMTTKEKMQAKGGLMSKLFGRRDRKRDKR